MDVSYGSDAQQKMDVYLPSLRNEKTRGIILVHGGGWTAGDKSDYSAYVAEFKRRLPGYAFINLNYRLAKSSGNYFPTQENDMKLAMEFLKEKTKEYHISGDFVYVGISAGAHLSMLQGYKHNDIVQPKGIVSFFGPVDLERLYVNSDSSVPYVLRQITRASVESNPEIFEESSPINYVSSSSPPTLMLHGDADRIVPLEQAEMLQKKLDEAGVFNRLIVYPGLGHGWLGDDLLDSFDKMVAFIRGLEN